MTSAVFKGKVYISCFYEEFWRERRALEEALEQLQVEIPDPNWSWKGRIEEYLQMHEETVRGSDLFIGIYGASYGVIVPRISAASQADLSYIEWDYRIAEEEDIPVLAFVQNVRYRDERLIELLKRILTRKGGYSFNGQKNLVEAIVSYLKNYQAAILERKDSNFVLSAFQQSVTHNASNKGNIQPISELIHQEPIKSSKVNQEGKDLTVKNPRAFISYSWDDEQHQEWVRDFATRLRNDGVDVTLDQWHTALGDQLPEFMERSVRENDFILIICSPKYKQRSEDRIGGVGYEGDIMTSEVSTLRNHRKFIPILRNGDWQNAAPSWLSGKRYADHRGEKYSEENYKDLLKTLHGKRSEPPPIGPVPQEFGLQAEEPRLQKSSRDEIINVRKMDSLYTLYTTLIDAYSSVSFYLSNPPSSREEFNEKVLSFISEFNRADKIATIYLDKGGQEAISKIRGQIGMAMSGINQRLQAQLKGQTNFSRWQHFDWLALNAAYENAIGYLQSVLNPSDEEPTANS